MLLSSVTSRLQAMKRKTLLSYSVNKRELHVVAANRDRQYKTNNNFQFETNKNYPSVQSGKGTRTRKEKDKDYHKEILAEHCDKKGCKDKLCAKLCSKMTELISHAAATFYISK
jgi:hypothetical protein